MPAITCLAPTAKTEVSTRFHALMISMCIIVGLIQSFLYRHVVEGDVIQYIEIADAYLRLDFGRAINLYWSPLMPWLFAIAKLAVPTSLYWEFALCHGVIFLLYLASLAAFRFYFQALTDAFTGTEHPTICQLHPNLWALFGYLLFLDGALSLIGLRLATPDMAVALSVYLIAGLLIKLQQGNNSLTTCVLLGLSLAFGSFAKSPIMIVAIFASLIAGMFLWRHGAHLNVRLKAFFPFLIFAALVAPMIFACSNAAGYLTFGEAGKINYLVRVNKVPYWIWVDPSLKHPVREPIKDPPTFEYAAPIKATYPPWYDPAYWFAGGTPRFSLLQQMQATEHWFEFIFRLTFVHYAPCAFLVVALLYTSEPKARFRQLKATWFLTSISLAVLLMYSLVYVETRFLAPFMVLFWTALLAPARWKDEKLAGVVLRVAIALFGLLIVSTNLSRSIRQLQMQSPAHLDWYLAERVTACGIKRSQTLAAVGCPLLGSRWAHINGNMFVAETDPSRFWMVDEQKRSQVISCFRKTGASAVVSFYPPPDSYKYGWQKIVHPYSPGEKDLYIFILR